MSTISNESRAFLKRGTKKYENLPTYLKLEISESISGILNDLSVYKFKAVQGLTNYFKNGDFVLKITIQDEEGNLLIIEKNVISGFASSVQDALEKGYDIGSSITIFRENDDNGTYKVEFNQTKQEIEADNALDAEAEEAEEPVLEADDTLTEEVEEVEEPVLETKPKKKVRKKANK